jgi:hypothetical protein
LNPRRTEPPVTVFEKRGRLRLIVVMCGQFFLLFAGCAIVVVIVDDRAHLRGCYVVGA